jgi:hypothetical protein
VISDEYIKTNNTRDVGIFCKQEKGYFYNSQENWRRFCVTINKRLERLLDKLEQLKNSETDLSLLQGFTDGGNIRSPNGNII